MRACSTDPFIGIDELRWFDMEVWLQHGPGLETHELQTCTQALHTSTIQAELKHSLLCYSILPYKKANNKGKQQERFFTIINVNPSGLPVLIILHSTSVGQFSEAGLHQ